MVASLSHSRWRLRRRSCIDHLGTAFEPAARSHFERNEKTQVEPWPMWFGDMVKVI